MYCLLSLCKSKNRNFPLLWPIKSHYIGGQKQKKLVNFYWFAALSPTSSHNHLTGTDLHDVAGDISYEEQLLREFMSPQPKWHWRRDCNPSLVGCLQHTLPPVKKWTSLWQNQLKCTTNTNVYCSKHKGGMSHHALLWGARTPWKSCCMIKLRMSLMYARLWWRMTRGANNILLQNLGCLTCLLLDGLLLALEKIVDFLRTHGSITWSWLQMPHVRLHLHTQK